MYFKKTYNILSIVALSAAMFFSCKNNFDEVKKIGLAGTEPLTEAQDIVTKHTDSGKLKMILQSPKMLDFSNRNFVFFEFPKGMHLKIYDDQKNENQVLSDYAIVYDKTNLIDLRGHVKLTTHSGDTLLTEQLYYDQKKEWIFTNKPVKFRTKDKIINGEGFDSDRNFKSPLVLKINGTIYVDEN